jgi:uncharacterized protein YcfJ
MKQRFLLAVVGVVVLMSGCATRTVHYGQPGYGYPAHVYQNQHYQYQYPAPQPYVQQYSYQPSEPVYSAPQVRCEPNPTAGAIMGAVAGGLLGSLVGGGNGNKIAIGAGAATGAIVGQNLSNCQ